MKKIRVAIVGAGFIGNYHARALSNAGNAELALACALPRAAVEKFAATYGVPEVTCEVRDVARRDDIDAVIIATPNKFHAPFALAMLHSGKDVLVEKPMAMNLKEAQAIAAEAKKHKRVVATGHMWRFDTEVNYIRQVVMDGTIGEVVKTKGYGIHVNWGPAGWFTEKKLAGGGALVDMGVHALDTVRYIMNDPRPKSVFSVIRTAYGDYDVDDMGLTMIKWSNGAVSVIESGWWNPHMDGPEAGTQLFGTKGYARVFPTELKLQVAGFPGTFTPPMPPRAEHCDQALYDRQLANFLAAVRNRKQPSPGLEVGLTIMKILDAAYLSSRTGKAVTL
jgi:predicted dehydrogenase